MSPDLTFVVDDEKTSQTVSLILQQHTVIPAHLPGHVREDRDVHFT